ncbi:MaoC family dehydratase [Aestuariibacter sp. AA17]|uniref:MaoC family dehydratase n=1 Tax=Fluctibacter corallii TaxID=2984329 RepID=A0ABT3A539_9ALTE|nr:MaoC family dehydratase [Aestuariibacter sp. AA17]MCV2883796.1 MaoC family dehydratase [Aestuariibacter sp. AA17]
MNVNNLSVGDVLPESDWIEITQAQIDQFAEATGDFQWIHTSPERCITHSPFGVTIAHGFLTASLIPSRFYEMVTINGETDMLVNYGIDKIRFLEPVRCGDLIKYQASLSEIIIKPTGKLFAFEIEVRIKDKSSLAMVGTFLSLLVSKRSDHAKNE